MKTKRAFRRRRDSRLIEVFSSRQGVVYIANCEIENVFWYLDWQVGQIVFTLAKENLKILMRNDP